MPPLLECATFRDGREPCQWCIGNADLKTRYCHLKTPWVNLRANPSRGAALGLQPDWQMSANFATATLASPETQERGELLGSIFTAPADQISQFV